MLIRIEGVSRVHRGGVEGCIEGVSRGASRCASRGSGIVRGNVVRGQGFSRLGVGEGEGVEGELVGGGC